MQTKRAKHIVDILLGVGLLLLMSYQVVGEAGHEWTAIAKLAPSAVIAPGLSVHYSGGSGLPRDVRNWLESQGIHTISND